VASYKKRIIRASEMSKRDEVEQIEKPAKRDYAYRHYIPANMPTVCPDCGHSTRMADGRYVDPVRRTILEYRTCKKCGKKLAAGRPMTEREQDEYCTRSEAVGEYMQSL